MDFTFTGSRRRCGHAPGPSSPPRRRSTYVRAHARRRARASPSRRCGPARSRWGGRACWSPEAHGGAGGGMLEAAVLCEEMGALPLPGPLAVVAVAGTLAAVRLDDAGVLPHLAAGTRRATVAVEETGTGDPLDGIATRPAARRGWRLDGLKPLVIDGDTADVAYVVARDPERRPGRASRWTAPPASRCPPRRHPQARPPGSTAARPAGSARAATSAPCWPGSSTTSDRPVRRERGAGRPGPGDGDRLRQAAGAVRPTDRHLPGDPAQDRGHAPPAGAGAGRHPLRRLGQRRRRPAAGAAAASPRGSWPRPPP